MSFECDRCGMVSHNPIDEREGYCGNCHQWRKAWRRRLREGLLEQMAEEMCAKGFDVETVMVDTHPDGKGVKVICVGCGRVATIPHNPGTREVVCPECLWGAARGGRDAEPPK